MKGLLTKDFALLLQRKKVFIFLAIWAVIMSFSLDDSSFLVGWMTVIIAFFAISSLTYDEYDNCFPFLMSLPVNGKTYALEKYLFGFLCGMIAWIFAAAVYFTVSAVKGSEMNIGAELLQMSVFIPVFMLLMDISLPVNMKYGTEKGRIIMIIAWCVVIGGIFALNLLSDNSKTTVLEGLESSMVIPLIFLLSALLTAVSILLSVRIMNGKEF